MSFENVIVNKPWGHEYVIYENDTVAIWILHIKQGHSTSLHSHPDKKTGLVLLQGKDSVTFISDDEHHISVGNKMNIKHGVFHKTTAFTDILLLEIETPKDKENLVRLVDRYGREGTRYETAKNYNKAEISRLKDYNEIGDCSLTREVICDKEQLIDSVYENYIVISGNITFQTHKVVSCGDIVGQNTLQKLVRQFDINDLEVFGVQKLYK
jgi:mannose-6-phosphate isomerase-like protein (cupin superfamily)